MTPELPVALTEYQTRYRELRRIFSDHLLKYFPVIIIVAIIGIGASISRSFSTGWQLVYTIQCCLLPTFVIVWLVGRRKRSFLFWWIVLLLMAGLGTGNLISFGIAGVGMLVFAVIAIGMTLFTGLRNGIYTLFVLMAIVIVIAAGTITGTLPNHIVSIAYLTSLNGWLANMTGALFNAVIGMVMVSVVQRYLFGLVDELQCSEVRYRSLFESADDAIFVMDAERFIDCNPKTLAMFGCMREQILGASPIDYSPEVQPDGKKSAESAREKIQAALEGNPQLFGWRHVRYDKTPFETEISLSRISINDTWRLFAIVRDVTERKKMESDLLREKAFSDAIINTLPGVFYLYEDGTSLVRWNKIHETVTGVAGNENLGKRPEDFFRADERPQVRKAVEEVWLAGARSVELTMQTGTGEDIPYLFSAVKFMMNDKSYLLGFGLDVSPVKQAEAATRESEERFRQIADNIEEVFFLLDKTTRRVLYVSPAIEKIFGISLQEIAGKPLILADAIHPDDRLNARFYDLSLRYSEPISEEFRIVRPDGELRWVRLRSFLIKNDDGSVYRVAGVVADITEQKLAQEENRLRQQQLLQADKMASLGLMVSGVAHEINNPNNLIMLNSDVMKTFWSVMKPHIESAFTMNTVSAVAGIPAHRALDKFDTLIHGVANGAERIRRIVQNLKDFARSENNDMHEIVYLDKAIHEAVEIIRPVIEKATVGFSVVIDGDVLPVTGNKQKLEQVVINLIANACQAIDTSKKKVTVTLSGDAAGGRMVLDVLDEGRGIPPGEIGRVFDPFYTTRRDSGGTGLGLSVSYGIIREHKGELAVASTSEKGTVMRVTLPVAVLKA